MKKILTSKLGIIFIIIIGTCFLYFYLIAYPESIEEKIRREEIHQKYLKDEQKYAPYYYEYYSLYLSVIEAMIKMTVHHFYIHTI